MLVENVRMVGSKARNEGCGKGDERESETVSRIRTDGYACLQNMGRELRTDGWERTDREH